MKVSSVPKRWDFRYILESISLYILSPLSDQIQNNCTDISFLGLGDQLLLIV